MPREITKILRIGALMGCGCDDAESGRKIKALLKLRELQLALKPFRSASNACARSGDCRRCEGVYQIARALTESARVRRHRINFRRARSAKPSACGFSNSTGDPPRGMGECKTVSPALTPSTELRHLPFVRPVAGRDGPVARSTGSARSTDKFM